MLIFQGVHCFSPSETTPWCFLANQIGPRIAGTTRGRGPGDECYTYLIDRTIVIIMILHGWILFPLLDFVALRHISEAWELKSIQTWFCYQSSKVALDIYQCPSKALGTSCNVDEFPKFSEHIGWMNFQNPLIETAGCLESHTSIDHWECNLLWYAFLVQGHEYRYHSTYCFQVWNIAMQCMYVLFEILFRYFLGMSKNHNFSSSFAHERIAEIRHSKKSSRFFTSELPILAVVHPMGSS